MQILQDVRLGRQDVRLRKKERIDFSRLWYTGLGTLGAVLVFALVGWLAPHPIRLYQMIAGGVLLLSFVPDIVLFTRGGSLIEVGAYMLMHIVTAVICVVGLTRFTHTRDVV